MLLVHFWSPCWPDFCPNLAILIVRRTLRVFFCQGSCLVSLLSCSQLCHNMVSAFCGTARISPPHTPLGPHSQMAYEAHTDLVILVAILGSRMGLSPPGWLQLCLWVSISTRPSSLADPPCGSADFGRHPSRSWAAGCVSDVEE